MTLSDNERNGHADRQVTVEDYQHITLTIDGYPICGTVGETVSTLTISVDDCWAIHRKWIQKLVEEGAPVCILRRGQWAVNRVPILEPKSWFITLVNEYEPGPTGE